MSNREKLFKLIIILIGTFFAIICVSPIFILLNSSFKGLKEIYINILSLPEHLSFKNYIEAFDKLDFMTSFTNSILITVASTSLIVLFSSMAAWVLVRYKTKKKYLSFYGVCFCPIYSISMCHAPFSGFNESIKSNEPIWYSHYVYWLWM